MSDVKGKVQIYSPSFLKLAQLYTAITQHFHIEEVDGILKNSGNINYRFPANSCLTTHQPELVGSTILHLAINFKDLDLNIFELLLNYGADYTLQNKKGSTALHQAVETIFDESKNLWKWESELANKYISAILSRQVQSQNTANPCSIVGISHFHIACMLNHQEAVLFFLQNGTPIDQAVSMSACYFPGYTALHFAARFCAVGTIEILLRFHAKLDVQDARGMTPIHVALERKVEILDLINVGERILHKNLPANMQEYEKVMLLLLKSCTLGRKDFVDSIGLTHFHIACTMKDTSMIEEYLQQIDDIDHFVKLDSPVWPGYTALHFAALFNVEIVKLLLKNGANMNAKDTNGISPFNICLESYDLDDIHAVISSHPVWKNITFSDGQTGLLDVIKDMSDCDYKLECENMNIFIPFSSPLWPGYTPLHIIVVFADRIKCEFNYESSNQNYYDYDSNYSYSNDYDEETDKGDKIFEPKLIIEDKYLAGGLNLTAQDAFGSTPIHVAFQLKKTRVIERLTKSNVMNSVNNDNLSHLHIAAAMDNAKWVTQLLKSGANVNLPVHNSFEYVYSWERPVNCVQGFVISKGSTALHIAVARNSKESISVLLSYGANVYAKDQNGMTPIHLQLVNRTENIMSKLPELEDCINESSNLSHLHVACCFYNKENVKKLLDQGANINAAVKCVDPSNTSLLFLAPYEGFTPLHFAFKESTRDICKLLIGRGANVFAQSASGHPLFYEQLTNDIAFSMLKNSEDLRRRMFEETGLTMLHLACYDLDYEFEKFRRWNIMNDINARSHDDLPLWPGCTPLDVFIKNFERYDKTFEDPEHSDESMDVEALIKSGFLKNGADVSVTNRSNETALLEFDRYNRAFRVAIIYRHEGHQSEDWTIFRYNDYITKEDFPEERKKVKRIWNKNSRQENEKIPPSESLRLLFHAHRDFTVNPANAKGISHFHVACLYKYTDVIDAFLKHEVDINAAISLFSDEFPGCTPLHLTMIDRGCRQITQLLLNHGASVHAQDVYGNTPLHFAAKNLKEHDEIDILRMIINKGADVNARNSFGETSLDIALNSRSRVKTAAMVELFQKHGYRINSFNPVSQEGWIPKALYNDLYTVITNAPDLTIIDDFGRNPVHNLSSYRHTFKEEIRLLRELKKQGCNVDQQDAFGRSALHIAVQFGNVEMVAELLKLGADININDSNGKVPFNYCFEPSMFVALRRSFMMCDNYLRQADTGKIIRIFVEHIRKLQLIGLDVSKKSLVALENLNKEIVVDFNSFSKQLEELKYIKINCEKFSIKLYDLLSETKIVAAYPNMLREKRQAISNFFESGDFDKVCKELDKLFGILNLQYKKAVERGSLIEDVDDCLDILADLRLPNLISELIIKQLSNSDLKNLKASVKAELLRECRRF